MTFTIRPAAEARTDTLTIEPAQEGAREVPLFKQWAIELNERGRIGTSCGPSIPERWRRKDRMVLVTFKRLLDAWRVIQGTATAKEDLEGELVEIYVLTVEITTRTPVTGKSGGDVFNEGETFGRNA